MVNTKSQTSPIMGKNDLIQDSRLVLNTKDLTEETLPKALRTQALTPLTSIFGLIGLVQYAS